jgi:hypothetical protein
MKNKTTIESATAEIEEKIGSYLQLSFSRAPKENHDALAQLEKRFVQWRMLSPRIEEEAAARMDHLAELSKEVEEGSSMSKVLNPLYLSSTTSEEVSTGIELTEKNWIRTRPSNRIRGLRSKQVRQP